MAIVETELKLILYLATILFFVVYNLEKGTFKTILTACFYPLALVLALSGIESAYGTNIVTLLGYIGLATVLYTLWNYFVVALPEAKKKQKNHLIRGNK